MRQKRSAAKLCWKVFRKNSFRFSNGLSLCSRPRPKFQIGEYVRSGYYCDDELDPERLGKFIEYYGFVTGIAYDSPEFSKPCWSYQIHWILIEGRPASEFSFSSPETVAED